MKGFEDEPIDWAPAQVWTNGYGVHHQMLKFIVPGKPVPKGNLIKGRYGGYHDPTKGLPEWLDVVAHQARAAMMGRYRVRARHGDFIPNMSDIGWVNDEYFRDLTDAPLPEFSCAVLVDVTFVLPRPKALKKDPPPPHTKKPDSDKLFRAIGDAMTGIVYCDDAQVIDHHARKRYAYLGESTGAIVMVTSNVEVT